MMKKFLGKKEDSAAQMFLGFQLTRFAWYLVILLPALWVLLSACGGGGGGGGGGGSH